MFWIYIVIGFFDIAHTLLVLLNVIPNDIIDETTTFLKAITFSVF